MKKYFLFLSLCICSYSTFAAQFTLESSAFQPNTLIPAQYTCSGDNKSPPLAWHNAPPKTKSFALVVEDPNGPDDTPITHWILFNIPPSETQINANGLLPKGAAAGKNSWNNIDYRGPCPSIGAHSYTFKIYALDNVLALNNGAIRDDILNAITGHVLASAQLTGLYQKIPAQPQ
ncbi:YbhB/YbcL family Raf kinase inhibitor-like protein [Legionella fallonii]|uniref:Phosphatidylethanolamine-binding protein n=1 Tax=Legionella fallonii LLAP-10 TaxID=1212491 RepID=A0A098G412_9GAMM|nr:YbhB/YbcL family Raf kinase inhibitor-like protein [Legionella fallonii]CEG57218.1 conserved exported protein of unknown function [Legionella fallonii LLAP-10]